MDGPHRHEDLGIDELNELRDQFAQVARDQPRAGRRVSRTALAICAVAIAVPVGVAGATGFMRNDPEVITDGVDSSTCPQRAELEEVFESYGRPYPGEFIVGPPGSLRCPTPEEVRRQFESHKYTLSPAEKQAVREHLLEAKESGTKLPPWAEAFGVSP